MTETLAAKLAKRTRPPRVDKQGTCNKAGEERIKNLCNELWGTAQRATESVTRHTQIHTHDVALSSGSGKKRKKLLPSRGRRESVELVVSAVKDTQMSICKKSNLKSICRSRLLRATLKKCRRPSIDTCDPINDQVWQ